MTQATAQQFEDLGTIKENVRFNEKAIDEIRGDIKGLREEFRSESKATRDEFRAETQAIREELKTETQAIREDMKAQREEFKAETTEIRSDIKALEGKVSELTQQFQSLGWKGLLGIAVIVVANVILKFIPSS